MLIAVYVDDVLLASNNAEMMKEEKAKLSAQFEMEDQGEVHYCLGIFISTGIFNCFVEIKTAVSSGIIVDRSRVHCIVLSFSRGYMVT